MKGLIVDKGEQYYSTFLKVFKKVRILSENYNWLVSNAECYPQIDQYREKLSKPYAWMTGEEVLMMLEIEDFQWIWGVISGFDKKIMLDEVLKEKLPYADGYANFWDNPITIQHTLAEVEIVAWDSTCMLFISKNDEIIENISELYPLGEDLAKYNI